MGSCYKYKVGDEVWYYFMGLSIKSRVLEIAGGKERLYRCLFYLTSSYFKEGELFPTKEALLNSRQNTGGYDN